MTWLRKLFNLFFLFAFETEKVRRNVRRARRKLIPNISLNLPALGKKSAVSVEFSWRLVSSFISTSKENRESTQNIPYRRQHRHTEVNRRRKRKNYFARIKHSCTHLIWMLFCYSHRRRRQQMARAQMLALAFGSSKNLQSQKHETQIRTTKLSKQTAFDVNPLDFMHRNRMNEKRDILRKSHFD